MANDPVKELHRRKRILIEAYDQVNKVVQFYYNADWDATALEADLKRIHLNLVKVQLNLEQYDVD